jgi:hypothetical protein
MTIQLTPTHKYNGGIGATICLSCSKIICTGLTQDLFCDKCLESNYVMVKKVVDLTEYKKSKTIK